MMPINIEQLTWEAENVWIQKGTQPKQKKYICSTSVHVQLEKKL